MATSDTSPTGDYGAGGINRQLPINDVPTVAAPPTLTNDVLAKSSVDNSLATTDGSPAKISESTQTDAQVERYDRQSILGKGGFGYVYKAWDRALHRFVAVKVNRSGRDNALLSRTRFEEEARAAAKLSHSNIVRVYDVSTDRNQEAFVVFEFIDGPSLAERIAKDSESGRFQPLLRSDAVSIVATVADAVHAAHKAGLVHRDLKPANILISENGQPCIVDFGLAVDEESQRDQKGVVAGSWFYMSPEQIRGETQYLDGRTDVWSLGVILYELLAGRRPFTGPTPADVQDEILNREPKPLRQIDDSISVELEQICFRCLSKQIKDRYSSAADVAKALRDYLTPPAPAPAMPLTPPPPLPSPLKRRTSFRMWQFVSLAAGIFLVSLEVYRLLDPPETSVHGRLPSTSTAEPAAKSPIKIENESIAKIDPPLPLPGPEPGKWFPLFKRTPELLVWPTDPRNSRWDHQPNDNELFVNCDGLALIKLGEVSDADYKIKLEFLQSPWAGNVGLFFGLKTVEFKNVTCRRFHLIRLFCEPDRLANRYRIERQLLTVDPRSNVTSQGIASCAISNLRQHEQVLTIEVEAHRLNFAEWGDNALREFRSPDAESLAGTHGYSGDFGVYVKSASGFVRNAELFLY